MARFTHIFRTTYTSEAALHQLSATLNNNPEVFRWHLDVEDIDKVLKVETESLSEECIIALARSQKIHCEVLPD